MFEVLQYIFIFNFSKVEYINFTQYKCNDVKQDLLKYRKGTWLFRTLQLAGTVVEIKCPHSPRTDYIGLLITQLQARKITVPSTIKH